MTYEEALNLTKDSTLRGEILPEQKDYSYMYRIIEALEKQIPMKPLATATMTTLNTPNDKYCWVCPNCVKARITETQVKYCSECGQAIDWSE